MSSERAIQQYRWKLGAGVLLFSLLITLALGVTINPTSSEFAHASEQVVSSPQCTSIWNCGASSLLPPMAIVGVGALLMSLIKGASGDE